MLPRRRFLLAALLGAAALLLLLLLAIPSGWVGEYGHRNILQKIVNAAHSRKLLIVLLAALCVWTAVIWVAVSRPRLRVGLPLTAAVLAFIVYGWSEFQQKYPNQGIFSLERLGDSAAILLGTDMRLTQFHPGTFLKVKRDPLERAAYPVIDVHFHLESLGPDMTPERLIQAMDAANIRQVVNLGGLPGMFEKYHEEFYKKYPDRIVQFVKPEIAEIAKPGGIEGQVKFIDKAASMGARGLKLSKSLGLGHRDATGKLVAVDDPRLDPIWKEAARLGLPVLIHTADPKAFFEPITQDNERYQELLQNPRWSYYGRENFPTFDDLMAQRERLLARHPDTIFIGAHMGMNEDDLAYAARLLDKYPNYYLDMSSTVHALGRQPYTARRFFLQYQDRILFGTDGGFGLVAQGKGWTGERMFRSYLEFVETDNEYIEYPLMDITHQGNWRVHGLKLPPEVLEKIYVRNAERLIPTEEQVKARLAGGEPPKT
jgi:predicted TIM-barrel fold metal-dependent hydrolase